MKIITNKETSVVVYAGDSLTLTETEASNGDWLDPNTTLENSYLYSDVEIPSDWVGGHYTYVDAEWALTEIGLAKATASLLESKTKATYKIDSDVDSLYGILVGNRASEYTLAEAQAKSFAEADYEGTPPDSVQSWADAKGWPATTAADDIIATANAWRQAQGMIRAQRLNRKEQIRVAITIAQVQAVLAAWNMFLSAIKQNLGGLNANQK